MTPRKYYPPAPPNTAAIGDIQIDDEYVRTPIGNMRRSETRFYVGATIPRPQRIASWGIACAVFLFFCVGPFSLLFLLAKEENGQTTTVRVTDGLLEYVAQVASYTDADYRLMLQRIEWSQRALPERRALPSGD